MHFYVRLQRREADDENNQRKLSVRRHCLRGTWRLAIVACHCNQCLKASGHYVAATQAELKDVVIKGHTLKWFQSSETAKLGFCSNCGSNLFWHGFGSHLGRHHRRPNQTKDGEPVVP
ncbi:GFA family protein [Mesorhizobium silamurunense]|uniref:GFA family protein n=1 Tax=Mesorhizobium silamurunense TaxID=499528 RepID=UPI0035E41969